MAELRDRSILREAQTHLEAYKRGEEWAKKNVFDNVDDLMADLMKEWNRFIMGVPYWDYLLIWIDADMIELLRLGSHTELFSKNRKWQN